MTQKKMEERLEANEREMLEIKAGIEDGMKDVRKAIATLAAEIAQLRRPEPSSGDGVSVRTVEPGENSGTNSAGDGTVQAVLGEDCWADRHKFKKVEMPVFGGDDPDNWMFRADRYFQIHKLSEIEKLTVAVISFEGVALNWYRAKEEREPFKDWRDLKLRLLKRFRRKRTGTVCGRFLVVKQTSTVTKYCAEFEALVAPLSHLTNEVLENTFMNGLKPVMQAEVRCFRPVGLEDMMEKAQLVEDRDTTKEEEEGPRPVRPKAHIEPKPEYGPRKEPVRPYEAHPMRTITLASSSNVAPRREGGTRRMTDAEFQARRDKDLCFKCEERYTIGHGVRQKSCEHLSSRLTGRNLKFLTKVVSQP